MISNYEEYQREVTRFWCDINDIKGHLYFETHNSLQKDIGFISSKINQISDHIPMLEQAKKFRNSKTDANINFREIYFSFLFEIKQKVGTTILDKKHISFKYPSLSH